MEHRKNDTARPSPRTTIRDIALQAGVSMATVSRVINGHPNVSPNTRETVLRYVRECGYATNRSARGLAGGRTGLIGLTVPEVSAEYFAQIVSAVAEALYSIDARPVVCPTRSQHDREVSLLDRLMHGTTDGAILVHPSESSAELVLLRERQYPFVVVDPPVPLDDSVPVVAVAHWSGAKLAMEHLLELGHRRIGAVTGPLGWCATEDRLGGYYWSLLSAGLAASPELVSHGDFLIGGGYRAAHQLLGRPDPPTAIFAFNDNMAIGALRAAAERGVSVPRDLSLVGFDDLQLASVVAPALTTVRQPLQEMGRVATRRLMRLIDDETVDAMRVELSTRLIVRESTAPPRDSAGLD